MALEIHRFNAFNYESISFELRMCSEPFFEVNVIHLIPLVIFHTHLEITNVSLGSECGFSVWKVMPHLRGNVDMPSSYVLRRPQFYSKDLCSNSSTTLSRILSASSRLGKRGRLSVLSSRSIIVTRLLSAPKPMSLSVMSLATMRSSPF